MYQIKPPKDVHINLTKRVQKTLFKVICFTQTLEYLSQANIRVDVMLQQFDWNEVGQTI